MKKILVCDDETRSLERWSNELTRMMKRTGLSFSVDSIERRQEFMRAISVLEKRRKDARRRGGPTRKWGSTIFDEADILIVDYDLLNLERDTAYVTGESLCYLCRAYSQCGYVVALNQFGTSYFDLTLKGHPESYADLNLGSEQLSNPGLWVTEWTGFRPWTWPLLPAACEAFERRWKGLVNSLDAVVVEFLEFPPDVVRALPRSILEFLGKAQHPEKTTFRQFVGNSGNGLRRKDKPFNDESVARIAAARIAKWLERVVLSGQDILVDAPHLVSRYPSLLKGDLQKVTSWNRTTSLVSPDGGLRDKRLSDFRFRPKDWLSRPAWFWKSIAALENIPEVSEPWSKETGKFVFCEDISAFIAASAAREFVADLPSNFVRRFVVNRPSSRASLAAGLQGVDYRPSVRFSL